MTDSIRIVIADDHPVVRQGLATVLGQEDGFEVVGQAASGLEAVAQAQMLHPDIILMDLQMPEMDGVEAIQKIKMETSEIGIIILTTYDFDDYIFRGIEAGAREYLLKDSPAEEVLSSREVQVLQLIAKSAANKEIANELFIGDSTVKNPYRPYLQQTGG